MLISHFSEVTSEIIGGNPVTYFVINIIDSIEGLR